MDVIFIFSVCGILLFGLLTLGFLMEKDDKCKYTAIMLIICICIVGAITITEPQRAITRGDVTVKHAQVKEITTLSIMLDNDKFSVTKSSEVAKMFPVNFQQFKVGDVVRYELINGAYRTYLIKIEKIK